VIEAASFTLSRREVDRGWSVAGGDVRSARPEAPVEGLLERYRCYLTVERSLTAETASGYVQRVRPFLAAASRPAARSYGLDAGSCQLVRLG
jgi:hypothetical protein